MDLNEPIAIVGMGCHFPEAPNYHEYWNRILENRSFIRPATEEYMGLNQVFDKNPNAWNKSSTNLAAPVGIFEFPYSRFKGVTPAAIDAFDYHAKYVLVAAQDAIENAGHSLQKYKDKTFVVLGNNSYETPVLRYYSEGDLFYSLGEFEKTDAFKTLSADDQNRFLIKLKTDFFKINKKMSIDGLLASMSCALPARIAKVNKFSGGYTAVDAACGSSLAAIDIAVKRLRAHSSDVAVAGGVGGVVPFFYVYCSKAKTMSAQGSFPFDTRASGFVVGEGAGIVVLKRLSTALQDGDHIHAVIRGVGASSDGSKTGPWAPYKEGQKLAMLRALEQVPYSIHGIQYIECHGTGTQVGDMEELTGIRELLGETVENKIPVGSAKAAVGHLLTGAGMAGLFRTVLAIQNKMIPSTANIRELIPAFSDPKFPLYVPLKAFQWKLMQGQYVRKAMVNSFGFGGTNFNAQLEEYSEEYFNEYFNETSKLFKRKIKEHKRYETNPVSKDTYNEPIAVVALSVRLPGAKNTQDFHNNLLAGKSFITEPTKNRWPFEQYRNLNSEGKWKTATYYGGYIEPLNEKEKLGWKIPPNILPSIDPNQFRLFSTVREVLEQSKILNAEERLINTSIVCANMMDSDFLFEEHKSVRFNYLKYFIENSCSEYDKSTREKIVSQFFDRINNQLHTMGQDNSVSGIDSMLASRVAKFFNMRGGSCSVDAVCASGVIALDHAINALRAEQVSAVVVCGSSMGMSAPLHCSYHDLTALSKNNSLKPFDKDRDGMLLGEGSVALVLKRLSDAQAEGLEILSIIHSIGISNDGTSAQMTSPVKETAAIAIKSAKEKIPNRNAIVEFIECHGSGTVVGDRIELENIKEIYTSNKTYIGSVKSSIGHLKAVSALSSLAKVILSLKNNVIYPTVNHINPDDFLLNNKDKIAVPVQPEAYKSSTPFAAVNSMGLGGVNGHVILSKYKAEVDNNEVKNNWMIIDGTSWKEVIKKL